jgi:spore coat protein A
MTIGTPPTISSVPEFFSDTILVNGAPYPTLAVKPQRYRFRFLNASQARFYNLQLFVADTTPDGITLAPNGELDNNGNPILVPTNAAGPAFIQIGNECGFLEKPAVFSTNATTNRNSNRPMGYKLSSTEGLAATAFDHSRADAGRFRQMPPRVRVSLLPGDPTIGNADRWNLLMAPAERPDVIIDFRGFAGKHIILYNDSPAPFPGGDIRNDYYVSEQFAFDLRIIGGAPKTLPGFGPDTRVLMRFDVENTAPSGEIDFAQAVTRLNAELPATFAATQLPDITATPAVTRVLTLLEDNEPETPFGRLRQVLGIEDAAPRPLVAAPTETPTAGAVERWVIVNTTADTHPMHFHLVNVRVRSRQQAAFDAGGIIITGTGFTGVGPISGPEPGEMGWKETVRMNPGEITTIEMKFDLPAGTPIDSPRLLESFGIHASEYVWHCHILEHEEHDMMHPMVVVPKGIVARRTK